MPTTTALRFRSLRWMLAFVACSIAACALPASPANAATAAPSTAALLVPVDRLIRGIDAASPTAIAGAYVFAPSIVDEFAPFHWTGGAAAVRWFRGFTAVASAFHLSHVRVLRHVPSYVAIEGQRAWLVVPTDYAYEAGGKPQRESAAWTFVLVSGKGGWRVESSTWAKTAGVP